MATGMDRMLRRRELHPAVLACLALAACGALMPVDGRPAADDCSGASSAGPHALPCPSTLDGSGGGGGAASAATRTLAAAPSTQPWLDPSKPTEERVEALLQQLTLQQKLQQLDSTPAGGVRELGVPGFVWQLECLHGMGHPRATMYPQPIAWAATFDDALVGRAASQIGDEMRAHSNSEMRRGRQPAGTHCFGPHPAIARDPRWGRISETYGEDPMLSANLAAAFVTGLQGGPGDGQYLKAGATCKHFIGNDFEGGEASAISRFNFNAAIDPRDLRDIFLPPFEACVKRGRASSIMCSYNAVDGVPACLSRPLLQGVLRGRLGFQGFVSTDCFAFLTAATPGAFTIPGGIPTAGHNYGTLRNVTAMGLAAGSDLSCQTFFGLTASDVSQQDVDRAARRVLHARVRLGHFNPPNQLPWPRLNDTVMGCAEHQETARKLAAESIVLLKNDKGLLPLRPASLRKVAVIGPFADDPVYLLGNYYTVPAAGVTTPLLALRAALPGANVTHSKVAAAGFTAANVRIDVANCKAADMCILFLGSRMHRYARHSHTDRKPWAYDPVWEGEQHDRSTLRLNPNQVKLWQAVASGTTTPLVVVLVHGGPLDIYDMQYSPRVGGILTAWYPAQGAAAVADVLLGKAAPSGRLPTTWYREAYTKLPIADLRMRASPGYPGRTHRYWQGLPPLYPFGYGLSYASFQLSSPSVAAVTSQAGGAPTAAAAAAAQAGVTVSNNGGMAADHVLLLLMSYLGPPGSSSSSGRGTLPAAVLRASGCNGGATTTDMVQSLVGYKRVQGLRPGARERLVFRLVLTAGSGSSWSGFGDPVPPCGVYGLRFGADQPVAATVALAA